MLGWPLMEMNGHRVSQDVSPGRPALTTKTTAGVDVTGRPSLSVDCQQGRPAHSAPLPFRHSYATEQSSNSILSGTCNLWNSFSSYVTSSYRQFRQIVWCRSNVIIADEFILASCRYLRKSWRSRIDAWRPYVRSLYLSFHWSMLVGHDKIYE